MSETKSSPTDPRVSIEATQLEKLRHLVTELASANRFYAPRLRTAKLDQGLDSLADFRRMEFTTKAQMVKDQRRYPPFGSNLTYPVERYVRFHQTSGTSGEPMRWLDTAESWQSLTRTWQKVFEVSGIGAGDRMFFPFSFGPFLGFWTAFDAATANGCLVIPGGGLSSRGRLDLLMGSGATAMCCTPTYAIRLAEVAVESGIHLSKSQIRRIIVAGEPGGSVPAVRQRIETLWPGARVFDHHGMTEVGPVSFPNARFPEVLHIDESSFLAEVLDPQSGEPVTPGQEGELVLTTLERLGAPLLRYRTGDLVRLSERSPEELGHPEMALDGGILSRLDDMVVVRGVNLFPSAIDRIVRRFDGVAEYRVTVDTRKTLTELFVEMETRSDVDLPSTLARQLSEALETALHLRIPVTTVPPGTLPRFELKAKRWVKSS